MSFKIFNKVFYKYKNIILHKIIIIDCIFQYNNVVYVYNINHYWYIQDVDIIYAAIAMMT